MSEVFLGINKAGQLYVDATLDASITTCYIYFFLEQQSSMVSLEISSTSRINVIKMFFPSTLDSYCFFVYYTSIRSLSESSKL